MLSTWEFDFDLMARLAKENPAEFARRREELILTAIGAFSSPEQGHRFQSEIDVDRMRNPPGQQTFIAIAKRLSATLARMSVLLEDIHSLACRQSSTKKSG